MLSDSAKLSLSDALAYPGRRAYLIMIGTFVGLSAAVPQMGAKVYVLWLLFSLLLVWLIYPLTVFRKRYCLELGIDPMAKGAFTGPTIWFDVLFTTIFCAAVHLVLRW